MGLPNWYTTVQSEDQTQKKLQQVTADSAAINGFKEQVLLNSIYYIRIVFMQLPTPCHLHDANPTAVLPPLPPNQIPLL